MVLLLQYMSDTIEVLITVRDKAALHDFPSFFHEEHEVAARNFKAWVNRKP